MRRLASILALLVFTLPLFAQTASVSMTGDSATCAFGTVTIGEASAPCDITVTNGTGASFTWRVWSNAIQQEYALTFTSVDATNGSTTVYHGAVPSGVNTPLNGRVFVVTGFTNPANNGTFTVTASNNTTLTLNNAAGVAETHAATGESQSNGTLTYDGDVQARVWGDVNGCVPNYINNGSPNPATWPLASGATCHILAYLVPSATTILSSHLYLKDASGNLLSTINVTGTGAADTNSTVALPIGINADYSGTVYDTTYPGDGTCTTYSFGNHVTTAAQLTTALSAASRGDTICITKGSNLSGVWTLPIFGAGTSYLTIRCAEAASSALCTGIPAAGNTICLPNGLTTGYKNNCTTIAANMATLTRSVGDNVTPVIKVPDGVTYVRMVGLEIKGSPSVGNPIYPNPSCASNHIILDRMYIHEDSDSGSGTVAISGACYYGIVDSWVETDTVNEFQAWAAADGTTNLKVSNSVIIGTGGGFIGGEIGNGIVVQPTDIEIRGNHFFRPMFWDPYCTTGAVLNCNGTAWDGKSRVGGTKGLMEFKEGQRILVTGNIFEQHFAQQNYAPLIISPASQHGNNVLARVADITIDRNIIRFTRFGFVMTAGGMTWSTLPTKRVYIKDLLIYSQCGTSWPNAWSSGNGQECAPLTTNGSYLTGMQGTRAYRPTNWFTVEHSTMLDGDWTPLMPGGDICGAAPNNNTTNTTIRNSIFSTGAHPQCASSGLLNNSTLNGTATNAFGKNLLLEPVDPVQITTGTVVGCPNPTNKFNFNWGTAGAWNSNWCWGGAQANANFIGSGSTPYLIQPATTYSNWAADGTDPGITSAVYTATACVATGTCGSGASLNPSLSPTSIDFGTQTVGTPSAPTTVTLTNNTGSSLTITSVALLTGTDFAITNNCSSPLASPGSCTVTVTCNATSAAAKTDTLRFTDSGGNSPQDVALTCTGTVTPPPTPTASLSCTPTVGFVQLGNSFTCTPIVTNATSCSVDNGIGPINCSVAFVVIKDIGSYSLVLTAMGAGGSADATPVSIYVQQRVAAAGVPF